MCKCVRWRPLFSFQVFLSFRCTNSIYADKYTQLAPNRESSTSVRLSLYMYALLRNVLMHLYMVLVMLKLSSSSNWVSCEKSIELYRSNRYRASSFLEYNKNNIIGKKKVHFLLLIIFSVLIFSCLKQNSTKYNQ